VTVTPSRCMTLAAWLAMQATACRITCHAGVAAYDALNAVYCFVSDAISGMLDLDEFADELGYTSVRECLRAWRACQDAHRKLKHVYRGDVYELYNRLAEIAG